MHQNQTELRVSVSAKDLTMIICAIGAYSHNLEYRDLRDRLQRQATDRGVIDIINSNQQSRANRL
jgi:hypothetical protein